MAGAVGVAAKTNPIQLAQPKTYHIEGWSRMSDVQRLKVIRSVALRRGRDPRIATLVIGIIRAAGVQPRDYLGQARCLLNWVQTPSNVYYVNEPGERLQDPLYTLKVRYGDCDDLALLLCCFFESIKLEWKLVISGRQRVTNKKVRHVEGGPVPPNAMWSHIYCCVGDRPFTPKKWYFCEPTLRVPLGWDVVDGDASALPEMGGSGVVSRVGRQLAGAFGSVFGGGGSAGAAVAATLADEAETGKRVNWRGVSVAVLTGVTTSVISQVILENWRERRKARQALEASR
jgi:hypothetical protein